MRLLLLVLCALARPDERTGPGYVHYAFTEPLRADMDGRILGSALSDLLATRGVARLTVQGPDGVAQYLPKRGRTHALKEIDPAVGEAIRLVLWGEQPGLELDVLIVPAPAEATASMKAPRVPVTVVWDAPEAISVSYGALFDAVYPTTTAEALTEKWGITLQSDGQEWVGAELGLIDEALSLLTEEELAVVRLVPFRRVRKKPPADGRHSADRPLAVFAFDPATGPRFEFYRPQVDRQRTVFRGTPDTPAAVLSLLVLGLAWRRRRGRLSLRG